MTLMILEKVSDVEKVCRMEQSPPPIQYVQAENPPGVQPIFVDLTVTVGANPQNPLQEVEAVLRDWFADHTWKEEIMGSGYVGEYANLGPNQLLELQTNVFTPRRWLRLRIESYGTQDWMGLVLRGDNCYAKGFFNQFGQCQLTERQRKDDPRVRVKYLPEEGYPHLNEDWELHYSSFLNCSQAELLQTMQNLLRPEVFVPESIAFLSNFNPFMVEENVEAQAQGKERLGGFVCRFVEFLRMRLDLNDENLIRKVQGWKPLSTALRKWKRGGYQVWNPKNIMRNMGLESLPLALNTCCLVLNGAEKFPDVGAEQSSATKMSDDSSSSKDGTGASPSGGGRESVRKDQNEQFPARGRQGPSGGGKEFGCSDQNEQGSTESTNIPRGQRMVQLLGVHANFTIQGINLYDPSKGQSIYERSCDAKGEDEVGMAGMADLDLHGPSKSISGEDLIGAEGEGEVGMADMADLDLHGPSKTISGEDLIGAEIFYPVSQQSKRSRGSEKAVSTELDAMRVQWPLHDSGEGHKCLVFRKSHRQLMQISCVVIENAIQAEILVKLLLGELLAQDYMVSGTIKASSSDYRGKYVTLFSERSLGICSCRWTCLLLAVPVVCVSHGAELGLAIDVNLKFTKPSDPTFLMEMAYDLRFSAEGEVNVKSGGSEFVVVLRMPPNP